ncbi:CidA/LrgA family protein [Litchfieldia salsa]|uniref:Holin-like protein n=1 Tax=Litchfieldia salsa TaxID=930152 RepID=A0A1H0P928_9BACI|nr:CidA/LrgA family protein [Litchfieldia salsa]SDP01215.1 holin-like protein [Litchfieldia salsa]
MKILLTIVQMGSLYGIYYIGCLIQKLLNISIPGSIIGMLLLFILLQLKIVKEKWLAQGSTFLLNHLAILFVPATVGVMEYFSFFSGWGFLTVVVAFISTVMVMTISGLIAQTISTHEEKKQVANERGFEA